MRSRKADGVTRAGDLPSGGPARSASSSPDVRPPTASEAAGATVAGRPADSTLRHGGALTGAMSPRRLTDPDDERRRDRSALERTHGRAGRRRSAIEERYRAARHADGTWSESERRRNGKDLAASPASPTALPAPAWCRAASFRPDGSCSSCRQRSEPRPTACARLRRGHGPPGRELAATGEATAPFSPDGEPARHRRRGRHRGDRRVATGARVQVSVHTRSDGRLFGPGGRLLVTTSWVGARAPWETETGDEGRSHARARERGQVRGDDPRRRVPCHREHARHGTVPGTATGRFEALPRPAPTSWSTRPSAQRQGRCDRERGRNGEALESGHDRQLRGPRTCERRSSPPPSATTGGSCWQRARTAPPRVLDHEGRVVEVLRQPAPLSAATLSPDGALVYTAGADGRFASGARPADRFSARFTTSRRGRSRSAATGACSPLRPRAARSLSRAPRRSSRYAS